MEGGRKQKERKRQKEGKEGMDGWMGGRSYIRNNEAWK